MPSPLASASRMSHFRRAIQVKDGWIKTMRSDHQYNQGHRRMGAGDSGQALLEFAISATMMLTLVFGIIDFSRAIYIRELITNLTGEGSSMASRGTSLPNTAAAVVADA